TEGCSARTWTVIATRPDTMSATKMRMVLLLRQLAECTLPVFDMIGANNLATLDRMDVDRHELERLAVGRRPHQVPRRRAGRLAAHDGAIARDQHLLDLPLEIGDRLETRRDPGNDLLPAVA